MPEWKYKEEYDQEELNIYYKVQRKFYRDDVLNYVDEDNDLVGEYIPDFTEDDLNMAVDHLENHFDCSISYWDNVEKAVHYALAINH